MISIENKKLGILHTNTIIYLEDFVIIHSFVNSPTIHNSTNELKDVTKMRKNEESIAKFENRIISEGESKNTNVVFSKSTLESYTRFYIVKEDGSAMIIYKKPTSGADDKLYDGKSHIVENFSMLPIGGSCQNTVYINAINFPHGDYEVQCGAR